MNSDDVVLRRDCGTVVNMACVNQPEFLLAGIRMKEMIRISQSVIWL